MERLKLVEVEKEIKPVLKQIWYIEYKLSTLEYRLKKEPEAFENLINLSNKLKPFFRGLTTQKLMDDLRGRGFYGG